LKQRVRFRRGGGLMMLRSMWLRLQIAKCECGFQANMTLVFAHAFHSDCGTFYPALPIHMCHYACVALHYRKPHCMESIPTLQQPAHLMRIPRCGRSTSLDASCVTNTQQSVVHVQTTPTVATTSTRMQPDSQSRRYYQPMCKRVWHVC
jgi:hypothetical protein